MIQYEAAIPADGPKIGAVTYNRLKANMPLQYDSTSIYEAGLDGRGPDQVDYTADTPYNTRVNPGLPPTPIAAPGEYALEGAMEPVDEPWLYFVLTDTKEVTFTVSYQEFLDAKALCKSRGLGCG
ncbi:endolytic transglycosylase MltG [Aquihabitans sp. G128]|uniref:endolytic transglycosylase MltG n=1 Tax=Aquihabitans sp. G128 TaxID=2849779 RepID=UPI001C24AA93|nr:endolytic transglycosylase MltG [Aquihabitans sp. G128]